MNEFQCECGLTERTGQHPKECEVCSSCGSKIVSPNEEFDTPLDHVPVERDENGRKYMQCKRCSLIING